MDKNKLDERPAHHSPNEVISLRLSPDLATAFRVEAAQRGKRLNALFEEMWNLYCRSGQSESRS